MAQISERLAINVPGRFYVDAMCIFCDFCIELAPEIFKEDAQSGFAYVFQQPRTDEERVAAELAVAKCPTESIGCDGDEKEPNQPPDPTRFARGSS